MNGFLEDVARDLVQRMGDGISECAILFPSQRTRLFFVDALARMTDHPMWQPRWTTIDRLMGEVADLKKGDRVRLITELYKIYSRYHTETFDKFYFWGDMLLADFDTIDKYLIDADMLFCNISDLKQIEADLSYLTEEQLQILRMFWASFGKEQNYSAEQRKFMTIWKTLPKIYHAFRERLMALGIAYTGMIHRQAVERIRSGEAELKDKRHYVVAGFNALSACEKELFKFLERETTTDFYWDYDTYYTENKAQEAGLFIRQNIVQFPPRTEFRHDFMKQPKSLTAVAAASNAVQCKYTADILRALLEKSPTGRLDKETAVVLTDENLLMPLLYALPRELGEVNVTMGYPLRQTMAYTFLERLVELQSHCRVKDGDALFYHVDVTGLLAHPYLKGDNPEQMSGIRAQIMEQRRIMVSGAWLGAGSELLSTLFVSAKTWTDLSDYLLRVIDSVVQCTVDDAERKQRFEFLTVMSEEITKLRNSLEECEVELSLSIYTSLLRRHLQTVRIPFKGEPLRGIQVMGILETRNLDFKNVIVLSMTDDNFPGNRLGDVSYVPYNLRTAYELPATEHHEGVYAYYFYRLIQRAETVHMVYCAHADDKSTGEPSRYIRQLDYESGFDLKRVEVGVDVNLVDAPSIEIPKDAAVMASLGRFLNRENPALLSPSSFSNYIKCPLSFYFHSVAHLRSDEEISEEVDAPMFGTILHLAAQKLYERVKNELHPAETLRALVRAGEVEKAVDEAINEKYLCDTNATRADYTGNLVLVEDIVTRYIKGGILRYDCSTNDFTVTGLEEPISYDFPFQTPEGEKHIRIGGIADRVDRLDDGFIRIVDYKTGRSQREFKSIDALFHDKDRAKSANVMQTLIYSMVLRYARGAKTIPTLYYVREMHHDDYSPLLYDKQKDAKVLNYDDYAAEFEQLLRSTLAELFDPQTPFRQVEDDEACNFCDFKAICRR